MAAFGCEVEGAGVEVSSDRGSVTNRAGEQSSFREGQRPMNQVSLEDNGEANPHLTQGARGRREEYSLFPSAGYLPVQAPLPGRGGVRTLPPGGGRAGTRTQTFTRHRSAHFKREFAGLTDKLRSGSAR